MHIVSRHRLAIAAVAAGVLLAGCGGGHGSDSAPLTNGPASAVFSSTSAPTVVVPRLVGRRQEEAHRLVDRAGLKLRWTGFTGKLGNGRYNVSCVKVLSQSPVAGGSPPPRGGGAGHRTASPPPAPEAPPLVPPGAE